MVFALVRVYLTLYAAATRLVCPSMQKVCGFLCWCHRCASDMLCSTRYLFLHHHHPKQECVKRIYGASMLMGKYTVHTQASPSVTSAGFSADAEIVSDALSLHNWDSHSHLADIIARVAVVWCDARIEQIAFCAACFCVPCMGQTVGRLVL